MKEVVLVVMNRGLHWLAAIGVFLLCDAIGVQQLAASQLERINYSLSTTK